MDLVEKDSSIFPFSTAIHFFYWIGGASFLIYFFGMV